jgi:hypothetical protein
MGAHLQKTREIVRLLYIDNMYKTDEKRPHKKKIHPIFVYPLNFVSILVLASYIQTLA